MDEILKRIIDGRGHISCPFGHRRRAISGMTDTRARHSLTSAAADGRGMSNTDLIFEDVEDTDVFQASKVLATV